MRSLTSIASLTSSFVSSPSSSSSRVVDSSTAPMVEGSSRDVSSPAVVGADAVVSSDTSTALAGEAGRDRFASAPARTRTGAGDGVVGWSIPSSSSVSEPTWTPAGPGRSRPSSQTPTPFARASAAVWNFFAVVVVVVVAVAGGEAGTAGDASRLFLLDLDLLCDGPRSRGAGIGAGRSSSAAAARGGADSSSRGTRSLTAADLGVSAASFPALFSSSRWTGAGAATRDATAGWRGRSAQTSPAEGPRAAGPARAGARSGERTSGGGFAHAFPASGLETTLA